MKERLKAFLKKLGLYHPLHSRYRNVLSRLSSFKYRVVYRKYRGSGYTCNFCGAVYQKFVPEYPSPDIENAIVANAVIAGYGENVYCPRCLSKNRERLVKDVIDHYLSIKNKEVLHFSPEKNLHNYLKPLAGITSVDITPGFYKDIDSAVQYADATALRFASESFDVIIANHILEHIPNDQAAMKELFRVLRKNGVAILQAPWSLTLPATIENPSIADPAMQAKLYGQKDHVRIYTLNDYVNRLSAAGFDVKVISPGELGRFRQHAIQDGEPVVLGYKREIEAER